LERTADTLLIACCVTHFNTLNFAEQRSECTECDATGDAI